ncbi:hypothetical protein HPP92_017357 [Vanilla planifolia]|uniref:Uncharacterized protein n=1 Tax=Vanilla planifolia TaxID=51239 RepID=A0A835QEA6_VANPL|nr:hypothetical protein HPP92_017357 [Vanilla planifolia]
MRQRSVSFHQDSVRHEYMSMRSMNERSTNESRYGFWGVLARKARSILEEDNKSRQLNDNSRNEFETVNSEAMGNRDGLTRVENRTAGIIQEKLQRKSVSFNPRSKMTDAAATKNISQHLSDQENQLKSSRDIRLQLETLLAEKGRLAQENFLYAQENRFLREIVEYHQLTMQDFVQLDDDDITELNKIGHMQMSSPRSSSQPASEVLSPVTSSTHTPPVPISPPSQNSNVEAESSSVAGPLSSILPASSKESPRWKRSPSTP